MDQVFAVRHLLKVSIKWERCIQGVYGFGKAFDTIDRHGM